MALTFRLHSEGILTASAVGFSVASVSMLMLSKYLMNFLSSFIVFSPFSAQAFPSQVWLTARHPSFHCSKANSLLCWVWVRCAGCGCGQTLPWTPLELSLSLLSLLKPPEVPKLPPPPPAAAPTTANLACLAWTSTLNPVSVMDLS